MSELPKLLYTKDEAAEMLSVSKWSIAWAIRTGKLPKRKIGREYMLTLEDLQVYIRNSAVVRADQQ